MLRFKLKYPVTQQLEQVNIWIINRAFCDEGSNKDNCLGFCNWFFFFQWTGCLEVFLYNWLSIAIYFKIQIWLLLWLLFWPLSIQLRDLISAQIYITLQYIYQCYTFSFISFRGAFWQVSKYIVTVSTKHKLYTNAHVCRHKYSITHKRAVSITASHYWWRSWPPMKGRHEAREGGWENGQSAE